MTTRHPFRNPSPVAEERVGERGGSHSNHSNHSKGTKWQRNTSISMKVMALTVVAVEPTGLASQPPRLSTVRACRRPVHAGVNAFTGVPQYPRASAAAN